MTASSLEIVARILSMSAPQSSSGEKRELQIPPLLRRNSPLIIFPLNPFKLKIL
jgi:hypothetical protein